MLFEYKLTGIISAKSIEEARDKIVSKAHEIHAISVDIRSDIDDECIILKRRTVV